MFSEMPEYVFSCGKKQEGNRPSLNNVSLLTYKGRDTDTTFSTFAEEYIFTLDNFAFYP